MNGKKRSYNNMNDRMRMLAVAYFNQLLKFGAARDIADDLLEQVYSALDKDNLREARHKLQKMRDEVEKYRRLTNDERSIA